MVYLDDLIQLDHFIHPQAFWKKSEFLFAGFSNDFSELLEGNGFNRRVGEDVREKTVEQGDVLGDELGEYSLQDALEKHGYLIHGLALDSVELTLEVSC